MRLATRSPGTCVKVPFLLQRPLRLAGSPTPECPGQRYGSVRGPWRQRFVPCLVEGGTIPLVLKTLKTFFVAKTRNRYYRIHTSIPPCPQTHTHTYACGMHVVVVDRPPPPPAKLLIPPPPPADLPSGSGVRGMSAEVRDLF